MTLHQAIETAKAKAANHPEWLRAIEKAATMLQSGELCVTLVVGGAIVTSPNGSYFVNGKCGCASRRANCYHRAAKRLVEMKETASGEFPQIADERAQVIADIKRAWPATWPPLAVELMARFRTNSLDTLNIDFLTAIRAAIA